MLLLLILMLLALVRLADFTSCCLVLLPVIVREASLMLLYEELFDLTELASLHSLLLRLDAFLRLSKLKYKILLS